MLISKINYKVFILLDMIIFWILHFNKYHYSLDYEYFEL